MSDWPDMLDAAQKLRFGEKARWIENYAGELAHDIRVMELRLGAQVELAAAPETLRDRMAMAALTGMAARLSPADRRINKAEEKCFAEQAYLLADAMLTARKGEPNVKSSNKT